MITSHDAQGHQAVLLHEAIQALAINPNGIYVDATFGRGGHSMLILKALSPSGRLVAVDRDQDAVAYGVTIKDPRFTMIHAPFSAIDQCLDRLGIQEVDGILIDLGVSSPQLDQAERGFSFQHDGPLDMRMDQTSGEPVSVWLARATVSEIIKVIAHYGEERFAVPIANAIKARCASAEKGEEPPLETTSQLATLIAETLVRCKARKEIGRHPATRTFQALRIHINRELEELVKVLPIATQLLKNHGRLVVISFHSIEDRIVKQFVRDHSGKAPLERPKGVSRGQHALLRGLADQTPAPVAKPVCLKAIARIRPAADEVQRNPRSRSATLRVAERVSRMGGRLS